MRQLLQEIWNNFKGNKSSGRRIARRRMGARPCLEVLESRLTPTTVSATGILSGHVSLGAGFFSPSGQEVTLIGTTTTGRTIDVTATADANGAFSFTQVLPATYKLT